MDQAPRTGRIKGFDGLRALAVSLVFLQHYTALGRDLETGGYGVWLFFGLSGFLIIRILVRDRRAIEADRERPARALGRFFWRRTLRIFPIYYLTLAVFAVLAALHWVKDFAWRDAAWYAAYLSNVYFAQVGHWVGRFGHLWSLAVEEQFYLLAAPLFLLSPARWARGLCAGVVLAGIACDLMLRSSGASAVVLYSQSLTNFGVLAFGGWIALGLPAEPKRGRRAWPAGVCLVLLVGLMIGFSRIGLFTPGVASLISVAPLWTAPLLIGLLLAAVYLNQESWAVRVLEQRPLSAFGRVSYGFYLYHNLLPHRMTGQLLARLGHPLHVSEFAEAAVAFTVALALAALSWRLIERPLLALKGRLPLWAAWRPGQGARLQEAQA